MQLLIYSLYEVYTHSPKVVYNKNTMLLSFLMPNKKLDKNDKNIVT